MDAFGYACLATSLVKGESWTGEFERWVTEATGKPAITAANATLAALQKIGVSRVALATPYPDTVNDLLPALFSGAGIQIVSLKSVAVRDSLEVCRLEPFVAYRLACDANTEDAEAVCILATDIRSIDVLGALERDLGKPAISTNQALLWHCLKVCGICARIDGFGSLLAPTRSDA